MVPERMPVRNRGPLATRTVRSASFPGMSSRAQLIERLTDLAGPLGPFTSPAEREHDEQAFLASLDASTVDDLIAIVTDPARGLQLHEAHRESYELLLEEALVAAGREDPRQLFDRVVPLLRDPVARPPAIDVLGMLALSEGVAPLDALLEGKSLSDDELERLACSLGDIGGAAAAAALHRMLALPSPHAPDVAREIEIALERIARSG